MVELSVLEYVKLTHKSVLLTVVFNNSALDHLFHLLACALARSGLQHEVVVVVEGDTAAADVGVSGLVTCTPGLSLSLVKELGSLVVECEAACKVILVALEGDEISGAVEVDSHMSILRVVLHKIDELKYVLAALAVVVFAEVLHMHTVLSLAHIWIPLEFCKKVSAKLTKLTVTVLQCAVTLREHTHNAVVSKELHIVAQSIEVGEQSGHISEVGGVIPNVQTVGDLVPLLQILGEGIVLLVVAVAHLLKGMTEAALDVAESDDHILVRLCNCRGLSGVTVCKSINNAVRELVLDVLLNTVYEAE